MSAPTDVASLEITVTRIGGPEGYPARFGPNEYPIHALTVETVQRWQIDAATTLRLWMQVELSNWQRISPDWWSVTVALYDINGFTIGRRPGLVYGLPYDHPSVISFYLPEADCLFAVSLRIKEATA